MKKSVEMAVGMFVLIGIFCVGYLSIKFGKMEWIGENYYPVTATFASVAGLKPGAEVQMAGVEIGKVEAVSLEPEMQVALVRMKIEKKVVLSEDVIASIKTSGLIGDKYVKISPGGSDEVIKPGDAISETESALDIEELVSKYVFGGVE